MTVDALKTLDNLAALERGWLDGDAGEKVSSQALSTSRLVIETAGGMGVTNVSAFPTEEGGVTLVFSAETTIEVSPQGEAHAHRADLETGTFQETDVPSLPRHPSSPAPIDWDALQDEDGYPTDYALEVVESFHGSPRQLVELIQRLWYPDEKYIEVRNSWQGKIEVRFVTCGWSGNESLISALQGTLFRILWWEMDARGGLHVFKVPADRWDVPADLGKIGQPAAYRMS